MRLRTTRPEKLLLAAFLLLLLALAGDLWQQRRAVPDGLRYVPLDSEVWVATGSLVALWESARPHLAGYFDTEGPATMLRGAAADLRSQLDKADIRLQSPDDLAAVGIDARAGLVFAHRQRPRPGTLIVLPVLDRERLIAALERWFDAKAKPAPDTGGLSIGDMLLAFGDDGSALLADEAGLLRESLAHQGDQLDRHRSIDRLTRRAERLYPGAAPAAWVQGRVQALPLIGDLQLRLEPHPKALRLRATALLDAGRSATLTRALAPAPPPGAQGHALLQRSDLALTIGDTGMATLLRLLAGDAAARRLSGIDEAFPGLLPQLQRADSLQRLSVAVLDTSQSVPGIVLGLDLSEPNADAVVLGVQSALRIKRDREIFTGIRQQGGLADDLAAVRAAEPQAMGNGPLWTRYRGPVARAEPSPALTAADFAGPDYQHPASDGGTLRDLMPPFTDDDLRWRLAEVDTRELRIDDLRAGRFRVSSAYRDGVLWVATDRVELERWLARLRIAPAGPDLEDATAGVHRSEAAKLLALALPQALNAAAALHPEADVREQRLQWLGDLAPYRSVLLSLGAGRDRGEMHLDVQFLRP